MTPADAALAAKLSDVTIEDVCAYVGSLTAKGTPWAEGCSQIIEKLWQDRARATHALRELMEALDRCEPYITGMHARNPTAYRGPTYGVELAQARALLESQP